MHILFYHNVIAEPPDVFDHFCRIQVEDFAREAAYLAKHFRPVSLPALLAQIDAGDKDPRSVAITFDDAYYGVFEHAFPVLAELGIPATVFVITETLQNGRNLPHYDEIEVALRTSRLDSLRFDLASEEPYALSTLRDRMEAMKRLKRKMKVLPEEDRARWHRTLLDRLEVTPESCREAARERARFRLMTRHHLEKLREAGWTLGSHTRSHRTLSCLDEEDLRTEVFASQSDMQREFGLAEMPFAYPYGHGEHIGERVPALVAEAGYTCGLTASPAFASAVPDRYLLPRMDFETFRERFG